MKKTLLACILTIVSACISTISAQENEGVAFLEGKTFAEAVEVAKESGKKIFLDCYTSWCGPCKMVARDIFPKKVAGDYFNQEFINIKIDMEKGEGPELAKRLGVKAYPTFVMFDSQGKEIGRLVGSRASAADFCPFARFFLNSLISFSNFAFRSSSFFAVDATRRLYFLFASLT